MRYLLQKRYFIIYKIMSWTKDYLRAKIFLSRKKFSFTLEMLFIVTLFTAIAKTRFSGLKRSSATILFHSYRKFDVSLPKTPSFRKKNASFIENNLPFVDIMFLSRKEAKGSTFRCLAIPLQVTDEQTNFLPWIICLLVNNFFFRCCLKNLTHHANPWSPSAFSASNQIPISHVLTELLKIFLPEVGDFFQITVIVVVVVSRDSPPCIDAV